MQMHCCVAGLAKERFWQSDDLGGFAFGNFSVTWQKLSEAVSGSGSDPRSVWENLSKGRSTRRPALTAPLELLGCQQHKHLPVKTAGLENVCTVWRYNNRVWWWGMHGCINKSLSLQTSFQPCSLQPVIVPLSYSYKIPPYLYTSLFIVIHSSKVLLRSSGPRSKVQVMLSSSVSSVNMKQQAL